MDQSRQGLDPQPLSHERISRHALAAAVLRRICEVVKCGKRKSKLTDMKVTTENRYVHLASFRGDHAKPWL